METLKSIESANLSWIYSVNRLIPQIGQEFIEHELISKMRASDKSEYHEKFYLGIERFVCVDSTAKFKELNFNFCMLINNYKNYNSSIIFLFVSFEGQECSCDDYARLISGNNILKATFEDGSSVADLFNTYQLPTNGRSFLINQLRKTVPSAPKDLTEANQFFEYNKYHFLQFLIRSDTVAYELRASNHANNLRNISSFSGSIDVCSGASLLQLHLRDLNSLSETRPVITSETRFGWMLSVISMIYVQKNILEGALLEIDRINSAEHKEKISTTNNLKNVLVNLQEYWAFDGIIHPMTAVKIKMYKEKLGVQYLFDSLQYKLESTENLALREFAEEQSKEDATLNFILFFIATFEILPFFYEVIVFLQDPDKTVNWEASTSSFILAVLLPILVLNRHKMRRMFKRKAL